MARAGKAAGRDVGMCLDPMQPRDALRCFPYLPFHPTDLVRRTLVDAYPMCGLGVFVATDGTLPASPIFCSALAPSRSPRCASSARTHPRARNRLPRPRVPPPLTSLTRGSSPSPSTSSCPRSSLRTRRCRSHLGTCSSRCTARWTSASRRRTGNH
ncbi:hypothetical protein B0H19DRAFT_477080 [Mycena capillaripes]|nr:hypothetical protein B0H19DRAFT_477080 [Mycena capillaripes]